jgi:uncharacterized protein YbcV (DUF1398 family)
VHYALYWFTDIEAVIKKVASVVIKASILKNQVVNKKRAQSKFLKVTYRKEVRSTAFTKLAAT